VRREYFPLLDGIRGLAAIAIMYRHMALLGVPVPSQSYLGVDLFFLLSGAVIANAYETRLLRGMAFGDFFGRRVIRLYPMIFLGVVLSAVMCLLGAGSPEQRQHLLSIVAIALLVLPDDPLVPLVSNLNGPAWSLFYEFLVNAGYAKIIHHLSARALVAICAFSGALLIGAAVYKGHLDTGYTLKSFVFGLGRVGFSFFAGVGLYRLHSTGRLKVWRQLKGRAGALLAVALLALALLATPSPPLRPVLALASVFFVFPTIVTLGLASDLGRRLETTCRTLGAISYPLYLIHFPLIQTVGGLLIQHGLSAYLLLAAILFGPAAAALAWMMDRWIDAPVRSVATRMFADWWSRRPAQVAAGSAID
jgi:peptidoglycan/LPS O-acetylase OafA/YrhL